VRLWDSDARIAVRRGKVRCTQFPFIVMTSNGERDFPAPFLRRCIRFAIPEPNVDTITKIVQAHLGADSGEEGHELIVEFVARIKTGDSLSVDQLLNAVFLLTRAGLPDEEQRNRLKALLMRELSRA
jgi:MoxR-like ATPase